MVASTVLRLIQRRRRENACDVLRKHTAFFPREVEVVAGMIVEDHSIVGVVGTLAIDVMTEMIVGSVALYGNLVTVMIGMMIGLRSHHLKEMIVLTRRQTSLTH
jgi:hypothetical protein